MDCAGASRGIMLSRRSCAPRWDGWSGPIAGTGRTQPEPVAAESRMTRVHFPLGAVAGNGHRNLPAEKVAAPLLRHPDSAVPHGLELVPVPLELDIRVEIDVVAQQVFAAVVDPGVAIAGRQLDPLV